MLGVPTDDHGDALTFWPALSSCALGTFPWQMDRWRSSESVWQ